MTAATLRTLADELGGRIVTSDNGGVLVLPDGGVVYCGFTGAIRLQRYGKVVETLGLMSDGTDAIVAAYHELTAVRA